MIRAVLPAMRAKGAGLPPDAKLPLEFFLKAIEREKQMAAGLESQGRI
jgi:hypothetical protein